jgi:hypothetical protein
MEKKQFAKMMKSFKKQLHVLDIMSTIELAGLIILCSIVAFTYKNPPPETYQLSSGKIVTCYEVYSARCGYTLFDCSDGERYECQTNMVRKGD